MCGHKRAVEGFFELWYRPHVARTSLYVWYAWRNFLELIIKIIKELIKMLKLFN